MLIRDFKDLIVWQKSVDLAVDIYAMTRSFPEDEKFGLTSQLRRASVSISSNIAEGNGRPTSKDYLRFLGTSTGSLNEVRSLVVVSNKLDFFSEGDVAELESRSDEIGKMLASLRASLRGRGGRR